MEDFKKCSILRNVDINYSGGTTAETNKLTDEEIGKIRDQLEANIVRETEIALGCHNAVKFEGTFVWPLPDPDGTHGGIIKLNVCP